MISHAVTTRGGTGLRKIHTKIRFVYEQSECA